MSDVMLLGALRQPIELWSDDPLFKMQQQGRCMEAADKIEALQATLSAYRKVNTELRIELTTECARRIKAEEVVDHAIAHASYAGTRVMAQAYRAQYPRVEKDHD